MPQTLSTSLGLDQGFSLLHAELLAEQAAALGRLGRALETALATLALADPNTPGHDRLVKVAADAVWSFFVQRESCGFIDHDHAIAHYAIPPKVLARVGSR